MKKILVIVPLILTMAVLTSCKGEKNSLPKKEDPPVKVGPEEKIYTGPTIILKLDDFGANSTLNSSSTQALDYLISKGKKAGIGVIASRLSADVSGYNKYINAKNEKGENLFEIWHHGLTHTRSGNDSEFQGLSYTEQKKSFQDADSIVLKKLGVQMHTFGAPFNQVDATTGRVISENVNYKVCMFANPQPISTLNLNNRVNLESGTGVVNYTNCVADFESKKATMKYMVLQGHPYMWNADMVVQFKQLVDYLITQDCDFVLPYNYYLKTVAPK